MRESSLSKFFHYYMEFRRAAGQSLVKETLASIVFLLCELLQETKYFFRA